MARVTNEHGVFLLGDPGSRSLYFINVRELRKLNTKAYDEVLLGLVSGASEICYGIVDMAGSEEYRANLYLRPPSAPPEAGELLKKSCMALAEYDGRKKVAIPTGDEDVFRWDPFAGLRRRGTSAILSLQRAAPPLTPREVGGLLRRGLWSDVGG